MRLDKYLKVSRLIKRRTLANEVADAGRVLVNGKPAMQSRSGTRSRSPSATARSRSGCWRWKNPAARMWRANCLK